MTKAMTLTQESLEQLTGGSENIHRDPLRPTTFFFTDGVRHVVEAGNASWLFSIISSYQGELRKHKDTRLRDYQYWKLVVHPDKSATLTCEADAGESPAVTKQISFTDFPLDSIDIWVEGDTAILPCER